MGKPILFFILMLNALVPDFFESNPPKLPHDFHTSIAEMNFNDRTKSFEISLRVFTDDLESALGLALNHEKYAKHAMDILSGRNQGKSFEGNLIRVVLDNQSKEFDAVITQYLQYNYFFSIKNQPKSIQWVGKELETDVTWLYFEIPLKENTKEVLFQNSVLTELYDDQSNLVNMTYKGAKKTFLFSPGNTVQPFGE